MNAFRKSAGCAVVLLAAAVALVVASPVAYPLPSIPPDPGTAYAPHPETGGSANRAIHHGTATWEIALLALGILVVSAVVAVALGRIRAHRFAHSPAR